MSFLEANQRTIDAIRKADKINLEDQSITTATGTETSFNFYDTSTLPNDVAPASGLQLYGDFVPMMSGNTFYCTMWYPNSVAPSEYAGWAINGSIHCRTASFTPTSAAYVIEACFAYQAGEGWVGDGTYGSDEDFRHSWLIATQSYHSSGGGYYFEPICLLLLTINGYQVIPVRWGLSIELKGVWT